MPERTDNWVYFHISRTGGSFVRTVLSRALGRPKTGRPFPFVHKEFDLDKYAGPQYKFFTSVRDPYARAVSCCAYQLNRRPEKMFNNDILTVEEFDKWLDEPDTVWYVKSQAHFLDLMQDSLMWVMRSERLWQDLQCFLEVQLPDMRKRVKDIKKLVNTSCHHPYDQYYVGNPDIVRKVETRYEDDFDRLPFYPRRFQ